MGKQWSNEQEAFLWQVKEEPTRKIKRLLKKRFEESRSVNSIYNKLYQMRKNSYQPPSSYQPSQSIISITSPMQADDQLLKKLTEREDVIYKKMLSQAELIRQYDVLEKYQNKSLKEISNSNLSNNEKKIVTEILLGKKPSIDFSNIEIIALNGKDNLHLILPLYIEEIVRSRESLASCLNDMTIAVMNANLGYDCGKRNKFRELVRYDFQGQALDEKRLGKELTDLIKEEHPTVKNISIVNDNIALYSSLR